MSLTQSNLSAQAREQAYWAYRMALGEEMGSIVLEDGTALHLDILSSFAFKDGGKILEIIFEDSSGMTTEVTGPNQIVFLVIKTKNLVGKKIDIDFSDAEFDYEFNGKILENDILKDFEITADTIKIELKSAKESV